MRIRFSLGSLLMMFGFSRPDRCRNEILRTCTGSFVYGLGGYIVIWNDESIYTKDPGGVLYRHISI